MRAQEVACFARALNCGLDQIEVHDLLDAAPSRHQLKNCDMALIGGSGDHSAAGEGAWLDRTFAALRKVAKLRTPTFASCWGFQAVARALGGRCIHDLPNAELGTIEMRLTEAGRLDPLFSQLPLHFLGHAGHQDHVVELPRRATLLASSDRVAHQAFKVADAPIYCTQFHPELSRQAFVERVEHYPQYVKKIAGVSCEEFVDSCRETPEANTLLKRFAAQVRSGKIA